ncbi:MAG: hypothetical protein K0R84_80 [Clostridia bacterium]|nr:hypothetical protein [Clostridia bacterium]
MLTFITKLITRNPIKIISITLIVVLVLAAGVRNVSMATGNETLIRADTKIYQDNIALESEFGGESIMVLFEGEASASLLTAENLKNLKELQDSIKHYDEIYSILSPVTVVNQISEKQYEKYKDGITEVSEGLSTMGSKLQDISDNLSESAAAQPALPDLDTKLEELNAGLAKMMQGQEKLKEGTTTLVNGYSSFGEQLKGAAMNLQTLSTNLQSSPELGLETQQQLKQLEQMSSQLMQASEKMTAISKNSAALPTVPENTIIGLAGIKNGLSQQLGSVDSMMNSQLSKLDNLKSLSGGLSELGSSLLTISDNLSTMVSYSDALTPSIPSSQKTLDKMIYDDNGDLRSIFEELILDDKYMLFIVRLNGNVSDGAKSEIVTAIKDFINKNPMESVDVIVSGKPVLDNAIRTSMKNSMQKMMGLSVVFMIIVLLLTFRVKWSLLPLLTIIIAVVGTVGLMGWLKIPVTMVSMAVFPILIGLGIDYAIQFQSRYSEEMEVEEDI